jgi:hypothetical protein
MPGRDRAKLIGQLLGHLHDAVQVGLVASWGRKAEWRKRPFMLHLRLARAHEMELDMGGGEGKCDVVALLL